MTEKKSYYAVIPANVRYCKKLTANAKLLYGEITVLCNKNGYCWAKNNHFANLYNVSLVSISKWINQLEQEKFIELIYDEEIVNILKGKNLKARGIGTEKCQWCEINTVILHKHHYPVSKKNNGEKIIKICPNCHTEFHNFRIIKIVDINIIELRKKINK